MARKKKTTNSVETASPVVDLERVGPEQATALAVLEPSSPTDMPSEVEAAVGEPESATASGPHWIRLVNLGRDNSGPKMRLGRSERFQQMAIQFDEKPTDETRIQLSEVGWRWRAAESRWTKQLEFESRARGQYEAEQLFDEIARHERSERGLAPTLASVGR